MRSLFRSSGRIVANTEPTKATWTILFGFATLLLVLEIGYMTQSPQPTITWEFLLGFGETWRLWVPLLFLLIWVSWLTRHCWGGRLLLGSLVLLTIFAIKVAWQERKIQHSKIEAWNRLRVPLPKAEKIDGLQLEAGTIVRWDQKHEGHLITAELRSPCLEKCVA